MFSGAGVGHTRFSEIRERRRGPPIRPHDSSLRVMSEDISAST